MHQIHCSYSLKHWGNGKNWTNYRLTSEKEKRRKYEKKREEWWYWCATYFKKQWSVSFWNWMHLWQLNRSAMHYSIMLRHHWWLMQNAKTLCVWQVSSLIGLIARLCLSYFSCHTQFVYVCICMCMCVCMYIYIIYI